VEDTETVDGEDMVDKVKVVDMAVAVAAVVGVRTTMAAMVEEATTTTTRGVAMEVIKTADHCDLVSIDGFHNGLKP